MKIFTVFATMFVVFILSSLLSSRVHAAGVESPGYILTNNQSVSSVLPISSPQRWNLVYQLNPTTPVVSAIQYQPELHIFVTENFKANPILLSNVASASATASESAEATESAKILKPATTASSAAVITIDKSGIEEATAEAKRTVTATPKPKPVVVKLAASDLDGLFEKYANEYGLSAGVIKHIAQCESGLRPEALSSNGLYGGLFQFVSSTWSGNRKAMGLDPDPQLRFNAEEAIKTAAFKISRDGYGAWPVCGSRAVASAV